MSVSEQPRSVYEAAGGADVMLALARAWHERVLADEIVAHAFSHGFHPHHTERLAGTMAAHPRSADEVPDGLSIPRWSGRAPP